MPEAPIITVTVHVGSAHSKPASGELSGDLPQLTTDGKVPLMLKRITLGAMLISALCASSTKQVNADEAIWSDYVDTCSNGIVADFELLLMNATRSDGFSRAGIFDYTAAPRFRVGYESALGAGARIQYFAFDRAVANGHNGALSSIDVFNIDAEIYKQLDLGEAASVEVSGGIRYNDYSDQNVADAGQQTAFSGFGGYVGVQAWHDIGFNFRGYARGKWAILSGDGNDNGTVEFDVNRTHQEIAVGVERCVEVRNVVATLQAGYEWQDWDQYQDNTDGSVGFNGFVLGVNFRR